MSDAKPAPGQVTEAPQGERASHLTVERRHGSNVRRIVYTCTNCGATDTVALFENEPNPLAVNCWKCGAGRGKQLDHMLAEKDGMFPPSEDEGDKLAN